MIFSLGNTNLINTTDQTKTIATGPNKSGTTSNWSMKLGKGTGESATIEGETSGEYLPNSTVTVKYIYLNNSTIADSDSSIAKNLCYAP